MTAIVSWKPHHPSDELARVMPPSGAVDGADAALLDRFRHVGLRCRASRKAPPIEACRLISDPGATKRIGLEMLMRSLPQALGRMPVLFAPGTGEMSFDEAWLLQLLRALRAGDAPSCTFLLRSRVPLHARRGLVFLLNAAQRNDKI